MHKEKDMYGKLMYYRPKTIYQTYNTINRSNNISFVLCEKEIRHLTGPFGYHITLRTVSKNFVMCTKYIDGRYNVTVVLKTDKNDHSAESVTITGERAKQIYERAKQYLQEKRR